MNNLSFDRNIYKAYVFFLPLGRFIELPLGDFVNRMITQMSTWFMLLGVLVLFMRGQFVKIKGVSCFKGLCVFMIAYSFLASLVLLFANNIYTEETPIRACLGDIVLYFIALLSLFYNYYHLTYTISFDKLYKLFHWQIIILLIVGYLQLGTLLGIGFISSIYIFLSSFLSLVDYSWLMSVNRGVCFFGTEPASVITLCLFVIPFILSSIYHLKKWMRWQHVIYLILFSILFLLSNSSSLLVAFVLVLTSFLIAILFRSIKKIVFWGVFFVGACLAFLYASDSHIQLNTDNSHDWVYVLCGKALDKENMSTAMRASTIINDIEIFYDYPFTGVGNGNQGFFYNQNVPNWVKASEEVQNILSGNAGIANGGGNFFPAYLSAFGLIGIIFFLFFLQRYKKNYSQSFLQVSPIANWTFRLGLVLFLFASWTVMGVKQNETVLFILALPCVSYRMTENRNGIYV